MIVLYDRICIFRPQILPEGPMNLMTGINKWVKVTVLGF